MPNTVLQNFGLHHSVFINKICFEDGVLEIGFLLSDNNFTLLPSPQITLKFTAVSALTLDFIGQPIQHVEGFDIIDISKNGYEKLKYQVLDYENGIVSFYCSGIERVES